MRVPPARGERDPAAGRDGRGTGAADLQHRKSHPHRPAHSADVNQPLKVALWGEGSGARSRHGSAQGRLRPHAAGQPPRTEGPRFCPFYKTTPQKIRKMECTELRRALCGTLELLQSRSEQQRSGGGCGRGALQDTGSCTPSLLLRGINPAFRSAAPTVTLLRELLHSAKCS